MKKENIILIALYEPESFAVRTLHALLAKQGFKVYSIFFKKQNKNDTINYPDANEVNALINKVCELNPVFVGISLRSMFFKLAADLTAKIKAANDSFIIWGGTHPTVMPDECLNYADAVCVGEGEETVVEMAQALIDGKDIHNIPNLYVKKNNHIIRNNMRPLFQNLDNLPFPDFSDKNKFFIHKGPLVPMKTKADRTYYWIMTSRGCMYNCTYCCNDRFKKIFKGKGKYLRQRSPENVIEELIQGKLNFPELEIILFMDDILFSYDLEWLKEFCPEYKKKINLPFFCLFYPKLVNEKAIRLLKSAGLEYMSGGIQSGSETFRKKYYYRHETNTEIIRAGKILKRHKIDVTYNIMRENPLETEADKYETIKLLAKLPKPFLVYPKTLIHFPKTRLTEILLSKGHISENDVEDKCQKSFEQWALILDLRNKNIDLFWDILYFLAGKPYIPGSLLLLMGRWTWLKSHPRWLAKMLRYTAPYMKTGIRSKLLSRLNKDRMNLDIERQNIASFFDFLKKVRSMKSSIDFSKDDGIAIIAAGWHEIEKQSRYLRWVSDQFSAYLRAKGQHRLLVIEGYALVDHFRNRSLTTTFKINNHFLGKHTFKKTEPFKINFELPKNMPHGRVLIEGENSEFFIPDQIYGNGDTRELSLAIYGLSFQNKS